MWKRFEHRGGAKPSREAAKQEAARQLSSYAAEDILISPPLAGGLAVLCHCERSEAIQGNYMLVK